MLRDEIEKRTRIRLESVSSSTGPAIVITRDRGPAEGYSLKADGAQVTLAANDARGMLFGIGRLLRELHMRHGNITIDANLNIKRNGDLNLAWTREPGQGGNGRGCQVSEIWLIKK